TRRSSDLPDCVMARVGAHRTPNIRRHARDLDRCARQDSRVDAASQHTNCPKGQVITDLYGDLKDSSKVATFRFRTLLQAAIRRFVRAHTRAGPHDFALRPGAPEVRSTAATRLPRATARDRRIVRE